MKLEDDGAGLITVTVAGSDSKTFVESKINSARELNVPVATLLQVMP